MDWNRVEKVDRQFALAVIWSAAIIYWVTYILIKFAAMDKGILNLLIGFMTGTAATILGVYFVSQMQKKPEKPPGTTIDSTTIVNETSIQP